jgi:hypothetical protein
MPFTEPPGLTAPTLAPRVGAAVGLRSDLTGHAGASAPVPAELTDEPAQGGGFIMEPDGGGGGNECDIFAQDCMAGEKCMPWANDGGSAWNATTCSPVAPNPNQVGDPCTVEGSGVSGVDDCDIGLMCWGVDVQTNMGECIELCSCNAVTPVCETPNTTCSISNQGVLPLCLPVCNPLDPSVCAGNETCVPQGNYFFCAPDASGDMGAAGDPCEYLNACDPGLFCANAAGVPGCQGASGCCSSLCPLGDASACLPGQDCVPWYAQGQAPDDCLGEVAACTIP